MFLRPRKFISEISFITAWLGILAPPPKNVRVFWRISVARGLFLINMEWRGSLFFTQCEKNMEHLFCAPPYLMIFAMWASFYQSSPYMFKTCRIPQYSTNFNTDLFFIEWCMFLIKKCESIILLSWPFTIMLFISFQAGVIFLVILCNGKYVNND